MTSLRTLTLSLGLLSVFGLATSTASAHELWLDPLTAARNLERSMHRLTENLEHEHIYCEHVLEASHHLEDLVCGFRADVARRAAASSLHHDFEHIVTDFRALIRLVRKDGLCPVIERDILAVRDNLIVMGKFVHCTPDFGHDCDFGRPTGPVRHGDVGYGRGGYGRDYRGHDMPIRTLPVVVPPKAVPPVAVPPYAGPRGNSFGVKLGNIQIQVRSR